MSEFGKDCEADAVEFTIEGASIRKQEEEEELGIRKKNQRETGGAHYDYSNYNWGTCYPYIEGSHS